MKLTDMERDTVLAALRYFQKNYSGCDEWIEEIATNGGAHRIMRADEIDILCEEKINA